MGCPGKYQNLLFSGGLILIHPRAPFKVPRNAWGFLVERSVDRWFGTFGERERREYKQFGWQEASGHGSPFGECQTLGMSVAPIVFRLEGLGFRGLPHAQVLLGFRKPDIHPASFFARHANVATCPRKCPTAFMPSWPQLLRS